MALAALLVAPAAQSMNKGKAPAAAIAQTGTKYAADADMQAVLDALASLNGAVGVSLTAL